MTKLIRFLFVSALLAAVAGCGLVALTIWYFGRNLPDYRELAHYEPSIMTRVQASDGRLLAEYATKRRVFVPISAIPKRVIDAFIAAEDKNFYSEPGFDPIAILRAAIIDIGRLQHGLRPEGASTITQQIAKNMLLSNELSIKRKIREILLATRLRDSLSNDRILELYLNQIYLGAGAYGVAEAALTYFDKALDDLTLPEAATLAALPKAPSRYDPVNHPRAARARRDWVLARMVGVGTVTAAEAAQAEAQPIVTRRREATEVASAPYFAEEVRRELLARYGERMLYESGLSVRTSLDPRLQQAADAALRKGLVAYDHARGGWRGAIAHIDPEGDWTKRLARVPVPAVANDVGWRLAMVVRTDAAGAAIGFADGKSGEIPFSDMRWGRRWHENGALGPLPRSALDVVKPGDVVMTSSLGENPQQRLYSLDQVPAVSGALIVIDPHTGRILALSGGFSFAISQFDRATQAWRQEGSAIKPFVYLTALEHGFTPSTLVLDAPVSIYLGPGLPLWTPGDYEQSYRGPTTLRIGLEHSLNTLTARVAQIIGMDAIAQNIERFGIMDHMPREYSMALGAGLTTPLRLTTAYAMLDNGGRKIVPTLIDRVQDRNGVTIYRADKRACEGCSNVAWRHQPAPVVPDDREQVADPASAFQIVSMLEGVVERGTGVAVRAVGKPIAGKTGTTNDWKDAWFEGFTPDLAAGVYVGFDDPKTLGKGEQAAVVSAPIFRDFMMAALQNVPATPFRTPPGVQLYRVNPATGVPPQPGEAAIWEPFKLGTNPTTNRNFALNWSAGNEGSQGQNGEPGEPVAAGAGAAAPLTAQGNGAPPAPHDAPRSGTGGLY